jgi:uncharacterized membrane protein
MDNGQLDLSTIIVVGVIAIIGAVLFVVGNVRNKSRVRMMGIAVVMGAGLFLFVVSAVLREILTALAALFAVIIAAFSIDESRRMRKDAMEREGRDRQERLIEEVTEWLRELEGRIFCRAGRIKTSEYILQRRPQISPEAWFRLHELDNASVDKDELRLAISEGGYYQQLWSKLSKELSGLIEVVVSNLKQRSQLVLEHWDEILQESYEGESTEEADKGFQLVDELIEDYDRPLEGLGLRERDIITVRFGRNARAAGQSIFAAIDKAIELRTSLIQVP